MSPQPMNNELKQMHIASCRICLLSKSHCTDCPLNWVLKVIEAEKAELQKDIEELSSIGDAEMESLFESCYP